MNKKVCTFIFIMLLISNVSLVARNLDYADQRTSEEQDLIEAVFDGDLSRAGPLMKQVQTTEGMKYILDTAQNIYNNWKFFDSFATKGLDQSYSKNNIKKEFEEREKRANLKYNTKFLNYKRSDCKIALEMIDKIINGKNNIIRTANATYLKMHVAMNMPRYSKMMQLIEKRLKKLEKEKK